MKDLAAERVGDRVLLKWTTPDRTTDDLNVRGTMMAEICRHVEDASSRTAGCSPVQRLQVTPGQSEIADAAPSSILADPHALLLYKIQIQNASGRSAGESMQAAFAAGGTAPEPVDALRAKGSQEGVVLEWSGAKAPEDSGSPAVVELRRTDLSAASEASAQPKDAKTGNHSGDQRPGRLNRTPGARSGKEVEGTVLLRAPDRVLGATSRDIAGTEDATAVMGNTYSYVAQRVRTVTIQGHVLEIRSEPSPSVILTLRDTFPPKSPVGLETVGNGVSPGATASIDLSWEPNTEADLAGYFVYRQLARPDGSAQGAVARLTSLPITSPAYRDVAVNAGQAYIYHVTAVDASGNESAPSAKAREMIESPQ